MFYIQSLEIANQSHLLPVATNVARSGENIEIAEGNPFAEIVTPIMGSTLLYAYEGFELRPEESYIQIALIRYGEYQEFLEGKWETALEPVFYFSSFIRQFLDSWVPGIPIQYHIRLLRRPDGRSPKLSHLKIGCWISADPLEYALNFGIKRKLGDLRVDLHRWVQTDSLGLKMPLPPGVDPGQIDQITAFQPGHSKQIAILDEQPGAEFVKVSTSFIPGEAVRLVLRVKLSVEYASSLFQISSYPGLILQLGDQMNRTRITATDSILLPNGKTRVTRVNKQYDQVIEVVAIAASSVDAREIIQAVEAVFLENAQIECPPTGEDLFVAVSKGWSVFKGGDLIKGNLSSATLTIVVKNLVEAEAFSDEATIWSIRSDVAPRGILPIDPNPRLQPQDVQVYCLPDLADFINNHQFILGGRWLDPQVGQPDFYEVEYRSEAESWTGTNDTKAIEFEYPQQPPSTYWIRVKAIYEFCQSEWVESEPLTTDEQDGTPWSYLAGIL